MSLAAVFYPGGNGVDGLSSGWSIFLNFFSDLGRVVAPDGEDNTPAAFLFSAAILFFGLAMIAFFLQIGHKKLTGYKRVGIITGIVSAVLFMFIVLAPLDTEPSMHTLIVALAFLFLLVSSFALARAFYPRSTAMPFIFLTVALVLYFFLTNMAGIMLWTSDNELTRTFAIFIQAISQKFIFFVITATMIFISLFTLYRRRSL